MVITTAYLCLHPQTMGLATEKNREGDLVYFPCPLPLQPLSLASNSYFSPGLELPTALRSLNLDTFLCLAYARWWVVCYLINSPSTLPSSLPSAKDAVKEHFTFDPSLLPYTIPRPPAMGRRTRTFSARVHSQFPGKMKGSLVSKFISSLSLNKSITWCIFRWSLNGVDFYTIHHFEETT